MKTLYALLITPISKYDFTDLRFSTFKEVSIRKSKEEKGKVLWDKSKNGYFFNAGYVMILANGQDVSEKESLPSILPDYYPLGIWRSPCFIP